MNRRSAHRRHSFREHRNCGWDLNLYRNTRDKKIAGVCAGLADHFEIAHWVVRLGWIALFCFTGGLAFWGYVAGWVLLAGRRPGYAQSMEYDEHKRAYRPRTIFRYGEAPGVRLRHAQRRIRESLHRVEAMESYVTSRQYNLNKAFSSLAD